MKNLLFTILVFVLFAIPISAQQLELSADLKPRYESKNGFKTLLNDGDEGNSFVSQRTRFILNFQQSDFLMKVSVQNVRVWGEVGTLSALDKSSGFHEAWAQFSVGDYFNLRLGRQEIAYDDQRIFGAADWAQQGRSHDAMIAKFNTGDNGKLDVGFALNNDSQNGLRNLYSNAAGYKTFQYVWYHNQFNDLGFSLLALNNGVESQGPNELEINYSQTFGSRFTYNKNKFSYDASIYFQSGKMGTQSLSAHYFAGNVKLKANDEFTVGVGLEYLSGKDMNDLSSDIKSFTPLYGTNHKFNGWMDYFYVGNHANSVGLIDVNATFAYKKDKFTAKLIPHFFSSAGDMYNAGAKISNKLGAEVDFTLGYKVSNAIQFTAGHSQMYGTKSMEVLKGGISTKSNNWTWMMLVFRPTLFTSN